MTSKAKILVVDDDPSIREILATQLGRLQFDTVTAADGEEALVAFKKEKPDVVLMDVMMPRMDGLTACQKIRASEKRGALSGGDDFVTKPISLQELRERVENALAKKKTP